MKSRILLIVAGLALLAALGAVALLSGGPDAPAAAPAAAPGRTAETAALPVFRDESAGSRTAPGALQAEPVPGAPVDHAPATAAAAPAGPTRTISGRVLRASDGTVLGGVVVAWQAEQADAPAAADAGGKRVEAPLLVSTETAEDGRFELAVPAHAPRLRLSKARASQELELPPGMHDVRDVEVVFDSGFRVAGIVLDEKGAPMPGATVDVDRQVETVADEAGRFHVLDVVRPDEGTLVKVRARAPFHAHATGEVLAPRSPVETPWVELRLKGSGRIEGRVTLAGGEPAARASVGVAIRMGTGTDNELVSGMATTTNEHGDYDIDHVLPGRYMLQAGGARAPVLAVGTMLVGDQLRYEPQLQGSDRLAEAWVPDVVVVTGQVTRLDIVLPAGAVIAGRVIDSAGAPVVDARLQLTRVARWPATDINGSSITSSDDTVMSTQGSDGKGETTLHRREGDTRSDEHGLWSFAGLPAGEHRLVVTDPGSRLVPGDRTLVLRGDERLDNVDFVLATGITMRSRVLDPAGRPLGGAQVYLKELGSNTLTDADQVARSGDDGFFEVSGLQPGRLRISISLEGYGWLWEEVDTTAPPPSYVLVPSPKLICDVVDALTGEAVEAFAVHVEFQRSSMYTDTQPHPGGRFEYDVPGDERCKVTMTAPGYDPLTIEDLLPSSTALAPARFRLMRSP